MVGQPVVTLFSMVFNTNKMGDWTLRNTYLLTVMTMAHVLGEIAHFLINTSGREVLENLIRYNTSSHL